MLNPWAHLAIEEYLLNTIGENSFILYLWRSEPTIVMGRYQNPWQECQVDNLRKLGFKIARRVSGGGTVYHDPGNLNFSFIMDKQLYNLEKQLNIILKALYSLDIPAYFNEHHDLMIHGKKFSGSAFCFKKFGALHHGTILFNAELVLLHQLLTPSGYVMDAKGTTSIRSPVINLAEINSQVTLEGLIERIIEEFIKAYHEDSSNVEIMNEIPLEQYEAIYQRHQTWKWQFGETPPFTAYINDSNGVQFRFEVERGFIQGAEIQNWVLSEQAKKRILQPYFNLSFDDAIRFIRNKEYIANRNESKVFY